MPVQMNTSQAHDVPNHSPLRNAEQPVPNGTFVPPVTVMLRGLGITEPELWRRKVTVNASFLRFLISEVVRRGEFDPDWYAERYPDVERARLAEQVRSLHQHYCTQGYFERRVPCELRCNPDWYCSHYEDVAKAFSLADAEALRNHYLTQGSWEGRAGTPEDQAEADRWLEAAIQAATAQSASLSDAPNKTTSPSYLPPSIEPLSSTIPIRSQQSASSAKQSRHPRIDQHAPGR